MLLLSMLLSRYTANHEDCHSGSINTSIVMSRCIVYISHEKCIRKDFSPYNKYFIECIICIVLCYGSGTLKSLKIYLRTNVTRVFFDYFLLRRSIDGILSFLILFHWLHLGNVIDSTAHLFTIPLLPSMASFVMLDLYRVSIIRSKRSMLISNGKIYAYDIIETIENYFIKIVL